MAKIENVKDRKEGSGYVLVFEGNKQLGHLMSRGHSVVISLIMGMFGVGFEECLALGDVRFKRSGALLSL